METTLVQPLNSTNSEELDIKDDIEIFEENLSLKDEVIYDDKSDYGLGSNTLSGAGDTGKSSLLKCDICLYETLNEADFDVHKKVHRKTYRCDSCHYICGNESKLLNHKKKLHVDLEDLLYFCGDCDFTTRGRETLKRHRRDEHQRKYTGKFHCSSCNFRSDNLRLLEKHSKTHLSLEERLLQCPQCSYSAVNEITIRRHGRKVHSELFLICDICNRSYKHNEVEDYEAHVNLHNWPREDGRFKCTLCKYSALHIKTVKKHIKEKHEGKKSKKKPQNQKTCHKEEMIEDNEILEKEVTKS